MHVDQEPQKDRDNPVNQFPKLDSRAGRNSDPLFHYFFTTPDNSGRRDLWQESQQSAKSASPPRPRRCGGRVFRDPKPVQCHRVLGRAASHGQHRPCSSRASISLSVVVRACNRTAALHGSRFAPACAALLSVTAVALAKLLGTRALV